MSKNLLQEAAINLKRAVPLMLKHQIPTTPTNYALWYAYVGQQNDDLNQELDTVVKQFNTCPSSRTTHLYRKYVSDPVELDVRDMRQNLDAMVTELGQSLKDTNFDATEFQNNIDANFDKLSRIENEGFSLEQVVDLVRSLVKESDNIRSSTQYFTGQLQKAQSEIDTLKQQLLKTEHDVLYDALTGALNRRAFDEDIGTILTQAPEGCCIILFDIDHFKAFNDNYGHQLGDQVLKAVAKRIGEACRDGTKLYRYGGEEFAVILPKSQLRVARQLAEGMRRSLEKLVLKDRRKGAKIDSVTASFGVAQWQQGDDALSLTDKSDKLLYEAKRLGRNRVMPISN